MWSKSEEQRAAVTGGAAGSCSSRCSVLQRLPLRQLLLPLQQLCQSMGESDAAYAKRMKAEKQARKAEKQARKAERKAKRAAKAAAGNPRTQQQEASAEPPKKKQKKAHVAQLDITPASPERAVDTGEPGHTPKVVHAVDSQTTPLAEREAAAAAAASAAAAAKSTEQQQLAAHATQVAQQAEEEGGFAASKGGMALVGLVARTIAESPALGVKNLYKKVCETLGERPGSGRAPNSREVRKIVAALKESTGLEAVMDAVSPYTNETKRVALYAPNRQSPSAAEAICRAGLIECRFVAGLRRRSRRARRTAARAVRAARSSSSATFLTTSSTRRTARHCGSSLKTESTRRSLTFAS